MLRDITIGQHFPGNSILHRIDPRVKLTLALAYIIVLFIGTNTLGLTLSVIFLFALYAMAKIPAKMAWRSVKPVLFVVAFTAVLNLLFVRDGAVLLEAGILQITVGGIRYAIVFAVRIVCLVLGVSIVTYTTSPIVLTDAMERMMGPLAKVGFPAHELAMMMTIALRFIPTLIEETDKIMSAQKARGAQLDTGNVLQRVKALIPVLIPLFLSAFRRADELALAMECRCYKGGEGRTRLRQLAILPTDILAMVICAVVLALIAASGPILTAAGMQGILI